MLRRTEIRNAVVDEDGAGAAFDFDGLVRQRREELVEGRREGPRPFLGEPPLEEERHVVLEKFYGRRAGSSGSGTITGTGASPGTAEGNARVVAGPDDFGRVRSATS